jgi:c(7)-type cytochrome triheme protein
MSLAISGILLRTTPASAAPAVKEAPPEIDFGLQQLKLPEDKVFPQGEGSPGVVTFRHASHLDLKQPDCSFCHAQRFAILKSNLVTSRPDKKTDLHREERCGGCHDGQKSFSVKEDCQLCHQAG